MHTGCNYSQCYCTPLQGTLANVSGVDQEVAAVGPVILAAVLAGLAGLWRLVRRVDHLTDRVADLTRQLDQLRRELERRQGR